MSETCRYCKNNFESGIWLGAEFKDEKVLLFCSKKCQDNYVKMKLKMIKVNYPNHYKKIKSGKVKSIYFKSREWKKNKS